MKRKGNRNQMRARKGELYRFLETLVDALCLRRAPGLGNCCLQGPSAGRSWLPGIVRASVSITEWLFNCVCCVVFRQIKQAFFGVCLCLKRRLFTSGKTTVGCGWRKTCLCDSMSPI